MIRTSHNILAECWKGDKYQHIFIYFFKHFHICNHDNNTYNQTISPSAYYPDADEENLFTALFV